MNRTMLFFFFIFASFLAYPQETYLQKIDRKDLSKYIRELSSPEFEGRQSGTSGGEKAARFIAEKFAQLQLAPIKNNSYFQPFTLKKRYIGESYIIANGKAFSNFGDYVAASNTNIPQEIEKTIIFGGLGTSEELDKLDVADKIVLVFHASLRNTMKLNDELLKRGAFGFMVANSDDDSRFAYHKRTSSHLLSRKVFSPNSKSYPVIPEFLKTSQRDLLPEFAVSNTAVASIMNLSIHKLNNHQKNATLHEVPAKNVRLKHQRVQEDFTDNNVVGWIKGKSARSIVVSAHYDHLGKRDDIYYPGADDNASGTAALLELAEAFARAENLSYSLIFLAASAEEDGLLGSDYFVENPIAGVTDSIVLNINIDMIGRDDFRTLGNSKNLFYFTAKDVDAELIQTFKKADALFPDCDMIYQSPHIEPYFNQSDQFNFFAKDIPSISLFSGLHDDYHRSTDTYDKIDYKKLTERVKLIAKSIELIQTECALKIPEL